MSQPGLATPMEGLRADPLPYVSRLQARDADSIDLVVIHCTELPDLATARVYGERIVHAGTGTGNSGHFYVDRDGSVHQWVPLERVAHHVRGYNTQSVGIELVNAGRFPDWLDSRRQVMEEPYPAVQIAALTALLQALQARLPRLASIAGHEDLDTDLVEASNDSALHVHRKRDPGPMFPWQAVLQAVPLRRMP